MKITNIEPQKNKERVNIYVDDLFAIGIEIELQIKHKLEVGMEVDEEYIKTIIKAEEQNKVTKQALNLLSFRQRSEKEIYDALQRKGHEEFYIEHTIDYCKEKGYLDDKSFAESFIRDKVNLNKLGERRIQHELLKKGVSQNIIDNVLDLNKGDQYEIALELGQKKLNSSYKKDDYNAKYRKLNGFLARKGYTYDVVSKVLKELLKD